MPQDWNIAIFQPILKKGDITDCENYRGIALLEVVYKILSKLITKRMARVMENVVGDYQGGFRQGRSTINQIFMLKTILEQCYEFNIDLHLLFIDFKKAYDSIDRKAMEEPLIQLFVPRKLIRLVQMTLDNNKGKVAIQGKIAE